MTYDDLNTLGQIKAAAKEAGNFFFVPETMRYWNSRISENVYPTGTRKYGTLFVESNTGNADAERRYSIRRAYVHSEYGFCIETVGDHQEFATAREAHSAAKKLRDSIKAVDKAFGIE